MGFIGIENISKEDFDVLDNLFKNFIPKHKKIFLFGRGVIAKAYYYYLKECGVNVFGCIQTSPERTADIGTVDENDFLKIPVFSLDELKIFYKIEDGVGVLLTIKEKFYDEVVPYLQYMGADLFFVGKSKYILLNHIHEIETCSFQVVDHCNLACYACNVAAPVAEPNYIDVDIFERDIKLLRRATGDRIKRLGITGGEAMLHPRLLDLFSIARNTFTDNQVELLTNGILLAKQNEVFWENLSTYNITIRMTKYPIAYPNFDKVFLQAKRYNVNLEIGCMDGSKDSCYMPLHDDGKSEIYDYALCPLYNYPRVMDGRLYPCCLMPEVKHLNKRFGTNITIKDSDSLDLEKVKSYKDVEIFMYKRLSLCSSCDLRHRTLMDGWMPSHREKKEWFSGC